MCDNTSSTGIFPYPFMHFLHNAHISIFYTYVIDLNTLITKISKGVITIPQMEYCRYQPQPFCYFEHLVTPQKATVNEHA